MEDSPVPVTEADASVRPAVRTRLNQRSLTLLVSGALTVVLGAIIGLIPAPYAIYAPGPVTNVLGTMGSARLIRVEGTPTYQPRGQLDMTTIEVFGGPGRHLSLPQVLSAWLSRSQAVLPRDEVFPPGQTAEQADTEDAAAMSSSQQSATAAGLREAGMKVPETVTIAEVSPDAPAARVLRAGDVITGVNGAPTADSTALRSAITALPAGAAVTVQVRRGSTKLTERTTTIGQDGRTVLGVGLDPAFRFPVKVTFATREVGGPSAGLMFALGIYDLVTPGDLTGGRQIAGTGTIDPAGTVGRIGGIAQKMVGAREAGARWFLAPEGNCDAVAGNVPKGLQVVRTATLHQARTAVEAIAQGKGSSLPSCAG